MHVFGWRQPTNHDAVYDGSEAITSLSDAQTKPSQKKVGRGVT